MRTRGKNMRKVAVLHSDFGIGGAERLILDICLGLKDSGYKVDIYTNHFDKNRCFEEFKQDNFKIITFLNMIPLTILGKFQVLISLIKIFLLSIFMIIQSGFKKEYDFIVTDGAGYITVPLLKLFGYKILFYCHFPDQLLNKNKCLTSKIYRYPIDYIEQLCTRQSDVVAVNSEYTKEIVLECFKTFQCKYKRDSNFIRVFYPCVNVKKFERNDILTDIYLKESLKDIKNIFLSINRFERKKNLYLALKAFKIIKETNFEYFKNSKLIIMGGYDRRVKENVDYEIELQLLASMYEIDDHVIFLKSPIDELKRQLLHKATAVLYTPSNEHFGIVPIESMASKCPVIAVNSGGPKETIINNETGFLCESDPDEFANAMLKLIESSELVQEMGNKGYERVINKFSNKKFNSTLVNIIPTLYTI